ncbi:MAG: hypothetical protein JNL87_11080 [Burkholderiaceae bacterium]|nr:hypothetical protein [Burkholderiaceae bacterium]
MPSGRRGVGKSSILRQDAGYLRLPLPSGGHPAARRADRRRGAVGHRTGTALADRMFRFDVQSAIDAFLDHALTTGVEHEVMADSPARRARPARPATRR